MDTETNSARDSARRVLEAMKAEARKYRLEKLTGRMAPTPPPGDLSPPEGDEEELGEGAADELGEGQDATQMPAPDASAPTPSSADDEATLMEIRKLLARA